MTQITLKTQQKNKDLKWPEHGKKLQHSLEATKLQ